MAKLLTSEDIQEIFGISRGSLYQKIYRTRKGLDSFPLPLTGFRKQYRWTQQSIDEYVHNAIRQNTAPQAAKTKPENVASTTRKTTKGKKI